MRIFFLGSTLKTVAAKTSLGLILMILCESLKKGLDAYVEYINP